MNCEGDVYKSEDKSLTRARKEIKKNNCSSIDSMRSLLTIIGGEQKFIIMAIENSFFFCEDIIQKRFGCIKDGKEIDGKAIHARWSTSGNCYTQKTFTDLSMKEFNGLKGYLIDVLIDGGQKGSRKRHENFQVDKLINTYTGYTLKGNNPSLQNYIISHIWGNATDPRFYTNFWNVVLVPAWANFLLDKNGNAPQKSLASRFKATIMAICHEYYKMEELEWNSLSMDCPQVINQNDVIKWNYKIQVVHEKSKQGKFGLIKMKPIDLSK